MNHEIKIGTMVRAQEINATTRYITNLAGLGFESVELTFGPHAAWVKDMPAYASAIARAVKHAGLELSGVGVYGNPLIPEGRDTFNSIRSVLENIDVFGTSLFAGFTGCLNDRPLPESIPQFKAVWSDFATLAREKNCRIAFENCFMGGSWQHGAWNIAVNPSMWKMIFDALPDENVGLEWEPAHQLAQLINPLPQLEEWTSKIFHIHGKDATVRHDFIARFGTKSDHPVVFHRTPGFGDSNWTDIISELRRNHYHGNIDIEGWHDPVYRAELEMTGQTHALEYLKACRGGRFTPNF